MKLVVVFPRGQLSAEDKASMREADIIAVEADNPKAVTQLHLSSPIVTSALNGDALVKAAIGALCSQQAETQTGDITSAGRAMVDFVKRFESAMRVTARTAGSAVEVETKGSGDVDQA